MLKNYIKVAIRNLSRNKGFTLLNISGLVVGMAGAILIFLWISRELSVDRFHENGEYLYEVWNNNVVDGEVWSWNSTPKPIGPALESGYPEIISFARHKYVGDMLFSHEDENLNRETVFVDSTFLEMFSFSFKEGNPADALKQPSSIVINEDVAKDFFGDESPIGKTLRFDNKADLIVTGVMENLRSNTDFEFEVLITWPVFENNLFNDDNWSNNHLETFVRLDENADLALVNDKIRDIKKEHIEEATTDVFLYPIENRYLYNDFENGVPIGGNIDRVRMFTLIAVLILLIACINFMNLSTAQSERRSKEVGIRKVSGAKKGALVGQFMIESILLSLISGVIALGLVQLLLPYFNNTINLKLSLPTSSFSFWLLATGFILLTGILAGSYPAFFLSSFQPIKVLKGTFSRIGSGFNPRKILVVTQFTFAIILIASTIIVRNQIEHARNRKLGYDKSHLIYHTLSEEIEKGFEAFKRDLFKEDLAKSVSKNMSPITENWSNSWGIGWDGKDEESKKLMFRYSADIRPVETFGLTLLEGRDIDVDQFATDSTAALLNKEAMKMMGFENPIGELIYDNDTSWHVVGVVDNFLNGSPFGKDRPIIIFGPYTWTGIFHIKLNDELNAAENLSAIEKVFSTHYPNIPFEYDFVDDAYAQRFENQKRTAKLTFIFSGLAIMISCLGLFGLSAFAGEQRSKEVGVRKVLGASVARIMWLLSTDFVKLVLIAFLIAVPIAWYTMDQWLSDFHYRISISPTVFLITGIVAVTIAFLTISYQALKTASINPVVALKNE
ncbi:MAG: ABC transporter permease [Bacteroidota bacterium]